MLENVKVIQQCLSRLMVANCKVSTIKYEKKKKKEKLLRMKFDSKPVHGENDKYIPTKIKYMLIVCIKPLKVKKMPKEKVSFKYLSIIILYSVVKVKKKKRKRF